MDPAFPLPTAANNASSGLSLEQVAPLSYLRIKDDISACGNPGQRKIWHGPLIQESFRFVALQYEYAAMHKNEC
jgi:hypothetical protein